MTDKRDEDIKMLCSAVNEMSEMIGALRWELAIERKQYYDLCRDDLRSGIQIGTLIWYMQQVYHAETGKFINTGINLDLLIQLIRQYDVET